VTPTHRQGGRVVLPQGGLRRPACPPARGHSHWEHSCNDLAGRLVAASVASAHPSPTVNLSQLHSESPPRVSLSLGLQHVSICGGGFPCYINEFDASGKSPLVSNLLMAGKATTTEAEALEPQAEGDAWPGPQCSTRWCVSYFQLLQVKQQLQCDESTTTMTTARRNATTQRSRNDATQ
jgi:hypothetical protein